APAGPGGCCGIDPRSTSGRINRTLDKSHPHPMMRGVNPYDLAPRDSLGGPKGLCMTADPGVLRSERHVQIGALIQRDAEAIIARWCERVVQENPDAKRLHHQALRDDLPNLLRELGHSMAATEDGETDRYRRPAGAHGRQ